MEIGCVGMATVDTALFVERAEYESEAVVLVDDVVTSLGGKGLVAAIAMAHEGAEVAPLALIGRESRITPALPKRVRHDWLIPAQEEDTRIWLSVSASQEVVAWVAVGRRCLADSELEAAAGRYSDSVDCLYLSFEAPEIVRAALHSAVRDGKPVAANLSRPLVDVLARSDRALLREIVGSAHVLLCNAREAARVLHEFAVRDWAELVRVNAEIVVTEGDAGGAFSTAPFQHWQRYEAVVPRALRSVVGAGDTFNGALLAGRWSRGWTLAESCRRAAALAAECVSSRGSTILSS